MAIEWRQENINPENGYLSENKRKGKLIAQKQKHITNKKPKKKTLIMLKENLEYKEGFLYWKNNRGNRKLKGKKAGGKNNTIGINQERMKVHKIIDFLHNGDWYIGPIDHIDGNPLNNKIENLQRSSVKENNRNRKFKGYTYHKKDNRFGTHCTDQGGQIIHKYFACKKYGGYENTKKMAMKWRLEKMIEFEYPQNIIDWYKDFLEKECQI